MVKQSKHRKFSNPVRFHKTSSFLPSSTVVAERLCSHRCLSVHGGVHTSPRQAGRHTPPWQADHHPQQADPPLGRYPTPGRHPQQTATAADGTHPTGMHSCFFYLKNKAVQLCLKRDSTRKHSSNHLTAEDCWITRSPWLITGRSSV